MHKFSWRTLIIFVMVLLVGVILLGLGTAYLSKLKQQRRQASENDLFNYRASIEVFVVLTKLYRRSWINVGCRYPLKLEYCLRDPNVNGVQRGMNSSRMRAHDAVGLGRLDGMLS